MFQLYLHAKILIPSHFTKSFRDYLQKSFMVWVLDFTNHPISFPITYAIKKNQTR